MYQCIKYAVCQITKYHVSYWHSTEDFSVNLNAMYDTLLKHFRLKEMPIQK